MKKIIIIICIIGALSQLAHSTVVSRINMDSISQLKPWTIEQCISYAMEHNISVKKAELNLKSSEVVLQQSKTEHYPNLYGSLGQNLSNGNSIDPITSDFVTQQISSTNVGINTSVTLYKGNQINNKINLNKLQIEQSSFLVEETKNSIQLSILEAYLQTLYASEGIRIAENNLAASKNQLEQAEGFYEAKNITLKDYLDAQTQVANNQYSLINAGKNYDQQFLILKQLLELGPNDSFSLVESIMVNETLITDKWSVYQSALEVLPEMKVSSINLDMLSKSLSIAKGNYLPTISLSGSVGSGYTSTQDFSFGKQINGNLNQKVGLSLSIPIYDRGQTSANVQNVKIEIDHAKYDIITTEKEIYKKTETAWLNLKASRQQMETALVAQDAAKSSYDLAQSKYKLGSLTATDLIIAQNIYTNAELNYIQAKYLDILYTQLLQFYQGKQIKF